MEKLEKTTEEATEKTNAGRSKANMLHLKRNHVLIKISGSNCLFNHYLYSIEYKLHL